ncbi:MAG: hypothetical protein DRP08_07180, partial [Candidatus Aenigmatarchaeota archaeon]
ILKFVVVLATEAFASLSDMYDQYKDYKKERAKLEKEPGYIFHELERISKSKIRAVKNFIRVLFKVF